MLNSKFFGYYTYGFLIPNSSQITQTFLITDLANMYRLLKPITGAQQTLLDEVQAHIKTQGLDAISGLKGDTVRLQF